MNKSVVVGAIIIGAAIVVSPFIFDGVKQKQREEQQEKINIQMEITDVMALNQAATLYKKRNGLCPKSASDLVGVTIKREPKDRLGLTYETKGNCEFNSFKGISSKDGL